MAPYLNQIQLIGRAGHDPECYTLTDGSRRARLRLYQNTGTDASEDSTQVHNLVGWDRIADQLYAAIGRGDRVFVQGSLAYRKFPWNGQTQVRSEILVKQFAVLDRGRTSAVRTVTSTAAEPTTSYGHE